MGWWPVKSHESLGLGFDERRMRPGNADLQIGIYRHASGNVWERLPTEQWYIGVPRNGCARVAAAHAAFHKLAAFAAH